MVEQLETSAMQAIQGVASVCHLATWSTVEPSGAHLALKFLPPCRNRHWSGINGSFMENFIENFMGKQLEPCGFWNFITFTSGTSLRMGLFGMTRI
jgi:hypothetical protein